MSIKIIVLVFFALIIFKRPKLIADKHLSSRISPFPSESYSIPPFIPPLPPLTAQFPVVESSFPRVPALFVFGDSSVDFGTNNFLGTLARADRLRTTLYNVKVRRMVVMGLPPIGCAPYYLWKYRSQNGECAEEVNSMIMESSFVMRYTVDQLNRELPGASIIYCDVFESAMDILKNHQLYGFNETTEACCGLGRYKRWLPCISPEMACSDAADHLWWDQFHPTDAVNAILADNVWNGRHVDMCYPSNLESRNNASCLNS